MTRHSNQKKNSFGTIRLFFLSFNFSNFAVSNHRVASRAWVVGRANAEHVAIVRDVRRRRDWHLRVPRRLGITVRIEFACMNRKRARWTHNDATKTDIHAYTCALNAISRKFANEQSIISRFDFLQQREYKIALKSC